MAYTNFNYDYNGSLYGPTYASDHGRYDDTADSSPKRTSMACARCRKRKSKCSGDEGYGQPCSGCRTARVDCQWTRVASNPIAWSPGSAMAEHPTFSSSYSPPDSQVDPYGHYTSSIISSNRTGTYQYPPTGSSAAQTDGCYRPPASSSMDSYNQSTYPYSATDSAIGMPSYMSDYSSTQRDGTEHSRSHRSSGRRSPLIPLTSSKSHRSGTSSRSHHQSSSAYEPTTTSSSSHRHRSSKHSSSQSTLPPIDTTSSLFGDSGRYTSSSSYSRRPEEDPKQSSSSRSHRRSPEASGSSRHRDSSGHRHRGSGEPSSISSRKDSAISTSSSRHRKR